MDPAILSIARHFTDGKIAARYALQATSDHMEFRDCRRPAVYEVVDALQEALAEATKVQA